MAEKRYFENTQANESIDKFKLLSAYGGPGSIIHTEYGSIIISCIEEWGFLKKVLDIHLEAVENRKKENEINDYVREQAKLERNGNIGLSNDYRLLYSLKDRKKLSELKYLVLIPDIELNEFSNKVKSDKSELAINSSFMPKVFFDKNKTYKSYKEWFKEWKKNNPDDKYASKFFPPKYLTNGKSSNLTQDNIVLICDYGHISDFPWSNFLRWRTDSPFEINTDKSIDLFNYPLCCGTIDKPTAQIKITSSTANASGFDGKWLKCENCKKQVSLVGLMSVKIKCSGHKPWEAATGELKYYSGNQNSREDFPPKDKEICGSPNHMKVALTTANNLYFSRMHSSIYMPDELFIDEKQLKIKKLEKEVKELDMSSSNWSTDIMNLVNQIKSLKEELENQVETEEITDGLKEVKYRFEEYKALSKKSEDEINVDKVNEHLKIKDVTPNLKYTELEKYFSRILRIDNMKITSAQLDFSRVEPIDSDSANVIPKNIFRSKQPNNVMVYPVVENYGEGIFFAFNEEMVDSFSSQAIKSINENLKKLDSSSNSFSKSFIKYGLENNWQLYLVHSFSHLIMRELEFKCGYPTASLSERIYVSNDSNYKMYGCMIYTAEGAEGSMGGLIAQTNPRNLLNLITSALKRATICHSDPLCWESEGQGLFELNFASCFSCSLVSETSCEHRNIYLDRRILIDEESGFFKEIVK